MEFTVSLCWFILVILRHYCLFKNRQATSLLTEHSEIKYAPSTGINAILVVCLLDYSKYASDALVCR